MLSGMWLFVFISCVTTSPETVPADPPAASPPEGVKVSGNLPVYTESELAAAAAERQSCIDECVKDNQMRAVSPQEIRVDCERSCDESHFIGQVEVVPDQPVALPEQPGQPEQPEGGEATDRP